MLVPPRSHLDPMASPNRAPQSYSHGLSMVYAIPAQRGHGRAGQGATNGLSYAEHELLRSRKTPYGRIDEQYEAASLDKNIHVPASKHVLLSVPPQYASATKPLVSSQCDLGNQAQDLPGPVSRYTNGQLMNPQVFMNGPPRPWEFVGAVDSAPQQTISMKYYYQAGSQVPTVLPTTFHAHLGPTASPGQQYYGPYWPDGTFSPYRPAPVRDSRFSPREPSFVAFSPSSIPDGHVLRRSGKLPSTKNVNFHIPNYNDPRSSTSNGYLPFSERVFSPSGNSHLPYRNLAREEEYYNAETDKYSHEPRLNAHLYSSQQPNILRPGSASDRIAFRDRTFQWAHQVYVDLLARIQEENKLGKPVLNNLGQFNQIPTKVSIFPKPPQRSGPYFRDSLATPSKGAIDYDSVGHYTSYRDDDRGERPRTAIHSSQRRASEHDAYFGMLEHQNSRLDRGHLPHIGTDSGRRVSDTNIPQLENYQYSPLPPLAAMSALETIELLCHQANTPWADGMLLAGCLAYGLGNYTRALNWYQKVLAQDSRHVEAMSNLAATLLALGRRDDACQNWSMAVKLRPSYFEAVEHLIGLHCDANRAHDAIEILDYVESCLRLPGRGDPLSSHEVMSDCESDTQSRSSSVTTLASQEQGVFEYEVDRRISMTSNHASPLPPGFGSSGYAIPASDNNRLLTLIHTKGNLWQGLGNNSAAAAAFETAILIASGNRQGGIRGLANRLLHCCISRVDQCSPSMLVPKSKEPVLLSPERAQQAAERVFPPFGQPPGLEFVPKGLAYKAAISTLSSSLLALAKIYQDGMGPANAKPKRRGNGTREVLALYYLSLSLHRSPSTANNIGILLATVHQITNIQVVPQCTNNQIINYAGIAPGSGIALALQYYNYGLNIDPKHAHLYTNLGSLLKDLGQLDSAIKMYEIAVQCDENFDIALANLANAVKDKGRIADAIIYYRRAVQANPGFAEAVCGLATALNSVCNWYGRGGVYADHGARDRIHVDEHGKMQEARKGCGWMNRVVEIVDKQLRDGERWGIGILTADSIEDICQQLSVTKAHLSTEMQQAFIQKLRNSLDRWSGQRWEGTRVIRLMERAMRQIGWQWYQDRYKSGKEYSLQRYTRPTLPTALASPTAPTVLPFHTFTTPLSAKQVRQISQRNALRISVSALRSSWLPATVYPPPAPPSPYLKVGYVSSDFNNHPLAHLMQSIFGMHDISRVKAFCYATTSSDGSVHRQQIEHEAPSFHDASAWNVEMLVDQIVRDGIHILINLNGYTRGAKNEVFAVRPAPIHMSFMGFAGTLGAEWCDYVFADPISVLPRTLSPWRHNVDVEDRLHPDSMVEDQEGWIYAENIIFAKSTFFCVDHKQSAPDANAGPPLWRDRAGRDAAWRAEQDRRWQLRKEIFPSLSDSAIILANFNQLYKIDPSTFRMFLRILQSVPNAILWLLRFPDLGEQNLKSFARDWAGDEVASRVVFTDVAPKSMHITRASIVDLFLDTPECNAHTTAADVIWSGTPIITWARWEYKMCSRMASSIVASALPIGPQGDEARQELLVSSEQQYERQAIRLASGLRYSIISGAAGRGRGRLLDLRRILWEGRWTSRLFDTKRWVCDLENAYWEAWRKWERGEGGDIWL